MARINLMFRTHDGLEFAVAAHSPGTLMEAATAANIPGIEAECGGCLTCCTCHVLLDPAVAAALPPPNDDELELLDFAPGRDPARSRLSCQIEVNEVLAGITVDVPAEQA